MTGGGGGGAVVQGPGSRSTWGEVSGAVQGKVLDVPHVAGAVWSEMWSRIAGDLDAIVDGITLADLVLRQAEIDRGVSPMYYI